MRRRFAAVLSLWGQKGCFVSTTFLQSKQDDSEGSSVVSEKDVNANISISKY